MNEINLIPDDISFGIKWTKPRIALVSLLPLAVSVILLTMLQTRTISGYRRQYRQQSVVLNQLRSNRQNMLGVVDDINRLISSAEAGGMSVGRAARMFLDDSILWSEVIGDLTRTGLEGVWLNRFKVCQSRDEERGSIPYREAKLEGRSITSGGILAVLQFLEEHPVFEDAHVYNSERISPGNNKIYRFSITSRVVNKP